MSSRARIIQKAVALLGTNLGEMKPGVVNTKAEALCETFIDSAIEETLYSIPLLNIAKKMSNQQWDSKDFKKLAVLEGEKIARVILIAPSRIEWYLSEGDVYFRGENLEVIFYYTVEQVNDYTNKYGRSVPNSSFASTVALNLASTVAFTIYSDSIFSEGLRQQFLRKTEEVRRLYLNEYHINNSIFTNLG